MNGPFSQSPRLPVPGTIDRSIFRIICAAYYSRPPHHSLISLIL